MKKTTFGLSNLTRVLFVFVIMLFAGSSFGQAIFSNDIGGTNPNADNPFTTGQVVNSNITATGIGRGTGIAGNDSNNRYNARGFATANTLDTNDYFSFTITPNTGFKINLSSFVYTAQKSGTGPKQFALRSSADNYTANIYTYSDTPDVSITWAETVDLTAATFQNVTGGITFRFYAWNAGAAAGTLSINDFIFNGTVVSTAACTTAAPVAAATQTFCGTTTVANLAATGTAVKWYTVATGGTGLDATASVNTGTYYAAQTLNGCEGARTTVAVTVNSTIVPTVGAQTFCNSAKVSDFIVTTGTAVKWYAAATGGTALASTDAVFVGTYYASQTLNSCESARTPVTVAITTTPVPTIGAQTFCNSAPKVSDFVITTGTAVKWYAAATGGVALDATTVLTSGTTYYATQTLNSCESARIPVTVTINSTTAPIASAQTFCSTNGVPTVANLTVTTGTAVKWYAAATGGIALDVTTVLATGTTYYASQTINSCESARTPVTVTINSTTAPTASAQTFCSTNGAPTVASLTVTTGTDVKWYAAATGGVALDATTVLVTSTTYYASQTLNSCESTRTPVTVTINTTAAPIADAQTFCTTDGVPTVASLTVTTGTDVKWYAAATGGVALDATTVLATGTTYYATQTLNSCESTRTPVTVTINTTAAPTASAQTFCSTNGAPTVANLSVTTGTAIKWYAAATGGVALDATTVLTTDTTYYASQTINGCESARTPVTVTINTTAAPIASAQTFCDTTYKVADLMVTTGVAPKWYAALTGGVALDATTALATGTTYYVSQTINGCESARTAVVVTIATAVKPEGEATQNFTEGKTLADLTVTGDNVVWYADADLTKVLPDTTVLTDAATYYAVSQIGICTSDALAITVKKVLSAVGFDKANFTYYPNPVNDVLTLSYSTAISSVQVYNMLGQVVITTKVNANQVQINTGNLTAGTYIVKATAGNKTQTFKVVKQ